MHVKYNRTSIELILSSLIYPQCLTCKAYLHFPAQVINAYFTRLPNHVTPRCMMVAVFHSLRGSVLKTRRYTHERRLVLLASPVSQLMPNWVVVQLPQPRTRSAQSIRPSTTTTML